MLALCLHLKNSRLDVLLAPQLHNAKGELLACQRSVQAKLRELGRLRGKRNENMANLRDLLSHKPMVSPLITSCPTFFWLVTYCVSILSLARESRPVPLCSVCLFTCVGHDTLRLHCLRQVS